MFNKIFVAINDLNFKINYYNLGIRFPYCQYLKTQNTINQQFKKLHFIYTCPVY